MSINVKQIVLHQLVKNSLNTELESTQIQLNTHLREQQLDISPEVEQMMLQLHQVYQSKAKGYGIFLEQSNFAQHLNRWLEKEIDFLPFSAKSVKQLATELSKYSFADSGTFIFCQYQFLATNYLFIALLDNRSSMLVDENLEVQRSQYLDIVKFDIAARINLTELSVNASSNRYLSFIKGRIGRKVGDFFMDFLGAEEGLNPQLQNQSLLQAVQDYCEHGELNQPQTQAVKKQVFEYCKEQINSGDDIDLPSLSENMPVLNQQPFIQFAAEQEYDLAQSIPPVSSTLKSLTKFSGSGKGVTLSFDSALLSDRIFWDEENDSLTIKGLPANLRDQLQRAKN